MKREILYSTIIHILAIAMVLFSSPFTSKTDPFDYGQVIKVSAITPQQANEMIAQSIEPPPTPQAVADDDIDIPIDDPKSIDEPVKIDKPKPKPEKPKPKPEKPKDTKPATKPPVESTTTGEGENTDTKQVEATGGAFAGATVTNESFNYPYWFTLADRKFVQNFRKTVAIDGSVTCDVFFEVIKSGRIIEAKIVRSSGFPAIDRDCLAVFDRIKSFPPLPDEFRDEIIGITLTIKY